MSGNTNPNFSIRADNGGIPSETILYTLTTSTAITGSWNLVTFTTGDQTTLHPNTRYWLHAANTGTTRMNLRNTDSNDEDTESNIDWQIGNNRYTRTGGTTWDQQLIGKTRMQINGHAIQQKEIIKLGGNGTVNNECYKCRLSRSTQWLDNSNPLPRLRHFLHARRRRLVPSQLHRL